jgi:hypothetical protein
MRKSDSERPRAHLEAARRHHDREVGSMNEGANKKPQRLIWGDVIAWLLVLVLVLIMPFVMFFGAILMGFKKIFGIAAFLRHRALSHEMKEAAN